MGHMNKVAIDKDMLNWLNSVSWWIDLELITCGVTCKRDKYKDAMYMYVCGYISNNEEGD